MQFLRGMKEASLWGAAPPPLLNQFPPLLHAALSKHQVGVLQRQKEIFARSLISVKQNSPTTGNALFQQLKEKPVTQVSVKQMRNESSAARHPLNSEAGTWHASNIVCLTRNVAQLLSLNGETPFARIRFAKGQHQFSHWSKVLSS